MRRVTWGPAALPPACCEANRFAFRSVGEANGRQRGSTELKKATSFQLLLLRVLRVRARSVATLHPTWLAVRASCVGVQSRPFRMQAARVVDEIGRRDPCAKLFPVLLYIIL